MPERTLLIFETHPVQYRVPVYQELQRLVPGAFEVIYASDFSVRGYQDPAFGGRIAWDVPLLEGYPHRVLGNEHGLSLSSWGSLTGRGVYRLLREVNPRAILMHSFGYRYDLAVYIAATVLSIPIWIRIDTQDEAFERGPLKGLARRVIYRMLYTGVQKAFYIGTLNREHYLRHGMKQEQMTPAYHCTPDRLDGMTPAEKVSRRQRTRNSLGIPDDKFVVAFFGKLIPKKDPALLLEAVNYMPPEVLGRLAFLFVGAGELDEKLRGQSEVVQYDSGVPSFFAGFINQSKLVGYYLASDVVVLPSRRMGETWGLVINEALQAGCGAIVSDAVGCSRDFGSWERVRVIPVGGAPAMADAIAELKTMPRDFEWASEAIKEYSIEAAARAIADELNKLSGDSQANVLRV